MRRFIGYAAGIIPPEDLSGDDIKRAKKNYL
jgi:hypothetical protein